MFSVFILILDVLGPCLNLRFRAAAKKMGGDFHSLFYNYSRKLINVAKEASATDVIRQRMKFSENSVKATK